MTSLSLISQNLLTSQSFGPGGQLLGDCTLSWLDADLLVVPQWLLDSQITAAEVVQRPTALRFDYFVIERLRLFGRCERKLLRLQFLLFGHR